MWGSLGRPPPLESAPQLHSITAGRPPGVSYPAQCWAACWEALLPAGSWSVVELPGTLKGEAHSNGVHMAGHHYSFPVVPSNPDASTIWDYFYHDPWCLVTIDNFYHVTRETGAASEPQVRFSCGWLSPCPHAPRRQATPALQDATWLHGDCTCSIFSHPESCPPPWQPQGPRQSF